MEGGGIEVPIFRQKKFFLSFFSRLECWLQRTNEPWTRFLINQLTISRIKKWGRGISLTILRKIVYIVTVIQGDPFKMSQMSGVAPCKRRFNPLTKFAMCLCRHREIHGYFFSSIGSVLNKIRYIKDEKWFWQYLNAFSLWKNIWNLTEMLNCYW